MILLNKNSKYLVVNCLAIIDIFLKFQNLILRRIVENFKK